jgi:poly-gamma-glutamate synthesis protein (capsule biosynthesis protein)
MVNRQGRAGAVLCALFLALLLTVGRSTPSSVADSAWTIALAGDVMLGRGVALALDGEWEAAFVGVVPWLAEADLAVANLESPLTAAPQLADGYDLRAPPQAVAALRAAGLDVLSVANNHAFDAGSVGLQESVRTLQGAGIDPWRDGVPAARLDLSLVGLALDDSTASLDVDAAVVQVARAAARGGIVVVSIHWGGEYQAAPSARQRAVARALAGAGATVIAGHGPHVLQRVEWVGETLVAYSLGNFLFDQPYPVDCSWGAILRVTCRGGRVTAVEAYPTVSEQGRVRAAGPDTAAEILARLDIASLGPQALSEHGE